MDYSHAEKHERFFPTGVHDPSATDRRVDTHAWARQMDIMTKLGFSPYDAVDGATVHDIPTTAFSGRCGAGAGGNKFAGYIDMETGVLHIDCINEPSFWLDIRLNECAFWKHAPGGEAAAESKASFEAHAAPQDAAVSSES